ncbi:MAG: tetratricopeptide repeat protein [Alphaproteobacteria bacterium]|jgi:tetratricopeptide (TPR) repeat protein|nr:tetratricopeptide repeat protein [Alphaproteobacteria bacterium]MBT7943356.1 tetratricopeptide repeat protein [Alphaproteobacteria bacterium]
MMGLSNPRVLKRFVILLGVATFVMFSIWMMINNYKGQTGGDYEVRQGDILLSDGKYEEAIKTFDKALDIEPNHRGALGGQAVALMGLKKYVEAESVLSYLIDFLKKTLVPDDLTGRGALAAAYGNRGILKDRQGRYEAALKDYIESIRLDKDLADGPGVIAQILYYEKEPSSILKRANYLYEQLKLPAAQRTMRKPEEDAKQRVYKP